MEESEKALPPYACDSIKQVLEHHRTDTIAFTRLSERLVAIGGMTLAELALQQRAMEGTRAEVVSHCAEYCAVGGCALKGFGKDLVNCNPAFLSPENRAKYEFYQRVNEIENDRGATTGVGSWREYDY